MNEQTTVDGPRPLIPGRWSDIPAGTATWVKGWTCGECATPAYTAQDSTGRPYQCCPRHGEIMPAPGITYGDVSALEGLVEQQARVVAAQRSLLTLMKSAEPTRREVRR